MLSHELSQGGKRPLIFSQWTQILNILEVYLEQLGHSFVRLDGNTAIEERQPLIDHYTEARQPCS